MGKEAKRTNRDSATGRTEPAKAGRKAALVSPSERDLSPTLLPNDHLRMLAELLKPAGPELARRWLAALVLAPVEERPAIVESVERRMAEMYAPEHAANARPKGAEREPEERPRQVRVVLPPRDRGGHTEQIIRTYEVKHTGEPKASKKRKEA